MRRRHRAQPPHLAGAALWPVALLFLAACAQPLARGADASPPVAEVPPAFVSAATPEDELDSVAFWQGRAGELWLIASAKRSHRLRVYDARHGGDLGTVGGPGRGLGEFGRPNGLAVAGDLLLVAERDNRRVQVLALPGFEPLGSFGEEVLGAPYGLWTTPRGDGGFRVFVTDSYMDPGILVPPPSRLDRRVREWRLERSGEGIASELVNTFGPQRAPGALRVVESIWGDPEHDRLLIAEEDMSRHGRELGLKLFSLDGRFLDRIVGVQDFTGQPEGISLWRCGDGSGYWVVSDQNHSAQRYLVYERRSLDLVGAFGSPRIRNTDGIWLHQEPLPGFPAGALFVVHDDKAVAGFDWRAIAAALGLPERCGA
jgi:3-phytase